MSIRRANFHDVVEHCDRLARQGQRLRPDQQPIVAFDADGTLWGPDVAELLWQRLIDQGALDRRAEAPLARALRQLGAEPAREPHADFTQLMELYRGGRCPEETLVRVMLQGLVGLREEDLYAHSVEAIASSDELTRMREGEPRLMIDRIRCLGFRAIVVSGSPRWAVEVAVRPIGIEPGDIIAGQVAVVHGVLTDGIIEPLPYGRGKIQAILRRYGTVPRVCLGNSLGDLAMFRATSDLRILVNPTDDLILACEEIPGATWSMRMPGAALAAPAGKRAAARAASSHGGPAHLTGKPPRRPTARS
ncbi:MAG TPA: HAD family hydrolase [Candidatus Polarisedimenticolia bacterium]|jgi:phosphoserine phosphatase